MKRQLMLLALLSGMAFAQGGMMPGPGVKGYSAAAPSSFVYKTSSVTGCVNATGSATGCQYALHANPAVGDLMIVALTWVDSGTQTLSFSCTNNGAFTLVGSKISSNGASGQFAWKVATVAGAETCTATISSGSSGWMGWQMTAYTYTGTVAATDGTPQYANTNASGGTATVSGLTTSNASDVVLAACFSVDSACTTTIDTGYTDRNDGAARNANNAAGTTQSGTGSYISMGGTTMGDKVNVAAGAQSATFHMGTTDANTLGIIAF